MSITCCINSGNAIPEKKGGRTENIDESDEDLQQIYQQTGLPLFDISDRCPSPYPITIHHVYRWMLVIVTQWSHWRKTKLNLF
jgi:hypothetical protein